MKQKLSGFFLLLASLPTFAQNSIDGGDNSGDIYAQQTSNNTLSLTSYLLNLGAYLGYNLTQPAVSASGTVSQKLLNATNAPSIYETLFDSILGAIPINSLNPLFVPMSSKQTYQAINSDANLTYSSYGSASSAQQGAVSASPLIDQLTYQADPVSQSVLNILTTPDPTYTCDNSKNSTCLVNGAQVANNAIGTPLPGPTEFFTYTINQPLLTQLNSNTLLSPLLYTTTNSSSQSTSSTAYSSQTNGLPAQSQAQQAANFIRYVTRTLTPTPLPSQTDYSAIYVKYLNMATPAAQQQAQTQLTTYLEGLRTYAAQNSVVFSNLYGMLAKRLPQNSTGSSSSQALNEFQMATWRLYNPNQTGSGTQWLDQINQASAATVQKEMVVLLAEINYQLYLSRQQEERALLTNTLLLLQDIHPPEPLPSASGN